EYGRCVDGVWIDSHQLPDDALRSNDVVEGVWVPGGDLAGLLEAGAPEEIGAVRVVHRFGEPSAEQHEVPLDQRVDEPLVRLRVEPLVVAVSSAAEENQDV